ncbi:hypothetical protein [Gluconacetobacter tumulisoli]|uniref:Formate hydrogenlyase subunit 4 n=1 Tax=Gluconacetobacter tumulisoli TaxID=1286189 RepID=A0A7W4K4K4_9PROT|nr:hypothetical protein [Gluconacetobacter tumulisoli]MBB2200281.1 hypothetical protein [Gluconacetobacter tumulisoli]
MMRDVLACVLGLPLLGLHLALTIAMAPVVRGLVDGCVVGLGGRGVPPVLMRWRWILALARRRGVRVAGTAATGLAAGATLAAALAACCLVPSFAFGLPGAGLSDLLLVTGLLGLARLGLVVTALGPGVARAGRAAVSAAMGLAMMQAVMPVVIAVVGLATGVTGIDGLLARMHDADVAGLQTPLVLAAMALLVAGLDEAWGGADAQAADMLANVTGPDRAALELARDLAVLAWMTLAGDMIWPGGLAMATGAMPPAPAALLAGVGAWLLRTAVLCAGLVAARLVILSLDRGLRTRLGLAMLFGVLAVVVLFAGREFG